MFCVFVGFEFKLLYVQNLNRLETISITEKLLRKNVTVQSKIKCHNYGFNIYILPLYFTFALSFLFIFLIGKLAFMARLINAALLILLQHFRRSFHWDTEGCDSSRLLSSCLFFNIPNATDLKIFKCWRIIAISTARNSNPSI